MRVKDPVAVDIQSKVAWSAVRTVFNSVADIKLKKKDWAVSKLSP